jgi:hypothetical protein
MGLTAPGRVVGTGVRRESSPGRYCHVVGDGVQSLQNLCRFIPVVLPARRVLAGWFSGARIMALPFDIEDAGPIPGRIPRNGLRHARVLRARTLRWRTVSAFQGAWSRVRASSARWSRVFVTGPARKGVPSHGLEEAEALALSAAAVAFEPLDGPLPSDVIFGAFNA